MSEDRSISFYDYLIIFVNRKKLFLILFFSLLVSSYLLIYFFVEEQYDSTALIIPTEQEQLGGIASLMKNFSGIPLSGLATKTTTNIYNTIIYSRSSLDSMIAEFDLLSDYEQDTWVDTRRILAKNIGTNENDEDAFEITVRADSPTKAADMTNFIVDYLNKTVIDLNIKKSRNNRKFLEDRYTEIKENLKYAEDSLKKFQEKSGVYIAEEQTKTTIETYARLESELAAKQIELSILEELYGEKSSQAHNAELTVNKFKEKLTSIKQGETDSHLLIPIQKIPEQGLEYYRLFRDVEIQSAMLEMIIPLYEQAKLEEQKEIPILQVIDYGAPPEKRSYPKRVISAMAIALIITLFIAFWIVTRELINRSNNPKLQYIRREIFSFRKSN